MKTTAISTGKANRLFWLGRYAERAYLSLHFLRRYFDLYLDGNEVDFKTYANNLGPKLDGKLSFEEFSKLYIFDTHNPSSIMSSLKGANDNAILLREVISTETLAYIQLSVCYLEKLKEARADQAVNLLQRITDYLLAFFGSIDEKFFNDKTLSIVRYGRFIESMDMHMRFGYGFNVIREVFDSLLQLKNLENRVFDSYRLDNFDFMLNEYAYARNDDSYIKNLLQMVNSLVVI
ncbi:alpha-E domain-containing protein [Succinivibrio sp.]|uniref:alpha-E domain-containing protein n=1 Tax=Succinivibrio sp. TaxID=2053619 RepID=UPI0025853EB9|nr:alpha-E domain-containing protein [Succinivibrio sp.]MCI6939475.1 alpha-E domain-containing protein [Succinatimonas hippei]MDD6206143.1 alpha-E domain-containing protein [Succinivibrio sp.]